MEGIVLLYQDFFADWIEVMKDYGLKKLGLHVNTEQNNMADFLCWLDANRPLIERAEDRGLTIEYFLHAFGYLLSEDPTYITNFNNARSLICKIDRDDLLQELVRHYLFD